VTRAVRVAVAAGLLAVLASCSESDGGDRSPSPSPSPAPASETAEDSYGPTVAVDPSVAERYGPAVEALGLRITRAARYEKLGSRTLSPEGRHLAVYVEPVAGSTTEAYLDRIPRLADVFLPEVFEQLPDLDTVDVCQEPTPDVDDSPEPESVTQLFATRSQAAAIDWSSVSLLELVAASEDHPNRIGLGVGKPVRETAAWQQLRADASPGSSDSG
jgi:hypothetical protein